MDTSSIEFDFGKKKFDEETKEKKLKFSFTLSIIYLKCHGMTWYNSLGFVNSKFDKNHEFFKELFGDKFAENQEKIKLKEENVGREEREEEN